MPLILEKRGSETTATDPLIIGIFSFDAFPIHSQFKAGCGKFFFAAAAMRWRSSKCTAARNRRVRKSAA
jgi:hypothetical protein